LSFLTVAILGTYPATKDQTEGMKRGCHPLT
jgi:hypothetical protein